MSGDRLLFPTNAHRPPSLAQTVRCTAAAILRDRRAGRAWVACRGRVEVSGFSDANFARSACSTSSVSARSMIWTRLPFGI